MASHSDKVPTALCWAACRGCHEGKSSHRPSPATLTIQTPSYCKELSLRLWEKKGEKHRIRWSWGACPLLWVCLAYSMLSRVSVYFPFSSINLWNVMFDDSSNSEVTKPLGDSSSFCIVILHIYAISTDNFCHKNICTTDKKYKFYIVSYFKIISISFKMQCWIANCLSLEKTPFPLRLYLAFWGQRMLKFSFFYEIITEGICVYFYLLFFVVLLERIRGQHPYNYFPL